MKTKMMLLALAMAGLLLVGCGGEIEREGFADEAEAPAETAAGSAERSEEATGAIPVDEDLPSYEAGTSVSGNLSAVGSDTLNNLMTLWAEAFRTRHPSVRIQIEGKGSSTAPPALIEGTAQLGPMSREMKPSELDEFEERFGYPPTKVPVAIDAVLVYAHQDNPLDALTITELDALFSSTLKCGAAEQADTWGEVGAEGAWAGRPVSLYGRNSASGTYGYFKEQALCGGDFRDSVKEQPGSASVVQSISTDRTGIGYSGIGYRTSGVKSLALAKDEGAEPVAPEPEAVLAGEYPLARFLYVYVNKPPNEPLDPLTREFLEFVLSRDGQQVVVKDGYLPLPANVAVEARDDLS